MPDSAMSGRCLAMGYSRGTVDERNEDGKWTLADLSIARHDGAHWALSRIWGMRVYSMRLGGRRCWRVFSTPCGWPAQLDGRRG